MKCMSSSLYNVIIRHTICVLLSVYNVGALTVVVSTGTDMNLILHLPSYTGISSPSDCVQEYSISNPCSLPIYRNTETVQFMHTVFP